MVYKQAYLINTDLKMKKGKIAAQVAHASMYYMEFIMDVVNSTKCIKILF